jgi:hypothetical protein
MDEVLPQLERLTKLLLKGESLSNVCAKLGIVESVATTWLEQYATLPNAIDALNESPVLNSICPVFLTNKDFLSMNHIGSGVLIELGSELFLLTAAHVTDQRLDGILHIPTCLGIEPICGFFADFVPFLSKTRASDKGDTSYCRLDRKFRETLHPSLRPLSITDLDLDDQLHDGDLFTFVGFPWRKTMVKQETQKTDRTSYTGYAVSEEVYESLGYSRKLHVAIQMKLKKAFSSRHGPRQIAPHPQGISGGGVFSWPRGLSKRRNSPKLQLAAIAHAYHRSHNSMVGSRIIGILIAILRNNPDLARELPGYVHDRLDEYRT